MPPIKKTKSFTKLYPMVTVEFKDFLIRLTDTETAKQYIINLKDKDMVDPKLGKAIYRDRDAFRQGVFRTTLSGDGKKLWNICPTFGTAEAKFKRFFPRNSDTDTPYVQMYTSKNGEYGKFFAGMEIVSSPFQGLEFTSSMYYKWTRGDENDNHYDGMIVYTDQGQHADYVQLFTEAVGIADDIDRGLKHPPNDNVLPVLEDLIIRKGKTFGVRFGTHQYVSVARFLLPMGSSSVEPSPETPKVADTEGWEDDDVNELEGFE